jgi:hypothetical protein
LVEFGGAVVVGQNRAEFAEVWKSLAGRRCRPWRRIREVLGSCLRVPASLRLIAYVLGYEAGPDANWFPWSRVHYRLKV